MNVQVTWQGKRRFEAQGASGHKVVIDAKPEVGGEDAGPRPMELLLMGLGGCTGIDITIILEKMRYTIENFAVEIQGERADQDPKRFTKIQMHYRLDGKDIPPEKVKRAIQLSAEKYCSAASSLNAAFVHTFELNGVHYEIES
ncbi:OsmC family protein [Fodinisporobacter ferrooxydans]|uniref:OsmC family protein n=1 Tax=Fodinisporobacter ferrooxydans TaxID=2901836 RepID=A0ABY4CW31_9BACL|nr:OsmC family protein [Alicyclobacillaceae bacterium MYW30-H2]